MDTLPFGLERVRFIDPRVSHSGAVVVSVELRTNVGTFRIRECRVVDIGQRIILQMPRVATGFEGKVPAVIIPGPWFDELTKQARIAFADTLAQAKAERSA